MIPEEAARRKSQAGSLNGQGLTAPDVADLCLHDAALAYAKHGWYVLPTDPADIKNPGALSAATGMSGRAVTPSRYANGGLTNPDYGIALHCGRSGAIVFDLDIDQPEMRSVCTVVTISPTRCWALAQSMAPDVTVTGDTTSS